MSKTLAAKPVNEPTAAITAKEAVSNARRLVHTSGPFAPRRCLQFVRTAWEVAAIDQTAMDAMRHAIKVGAFHKWNGDTESIPFGAPVFTRRRGAPAGDAGHVILTGGHFLNRERIFRSVDVFTLGDVDAVPIDFFDEKWNHEVLGWSDELNGYRLPLPPCPNDRR